jgi:hypothetical protein
MLRTDKRILKNVRDRKSVCDSESIGYQYYHHHGDEDLALQPESAHDQAGSHVLLSDQGLLHQPWLPWQG